ncbi:MAG: hypothetical protein JSU57_05370 [Candidatus Heimdallarchaeota archaeon]|nr:MAG: hypothetical protein JSU57_05370 [Candidatus Heimdallarchaeota archaeon]
MTEKLISAKVSKRPYHECLFLITSYDDTLANCLTLKLWNEPCPPRCPYYKAGLPGSLEQLARHYLIDCRKFSRKKTTTGQAIAYCKLHLMREPLCRQCNYPHQSGL